MLPTRQSACNPAKLANLSAPHLPRPRPRPAANCGGCEHRQPYPCRPRMRHPALAGCWFKHGAHIRNVWSASSEDSRRPTPRNGFFDQSQESGVASPRFGPGSRAAFFFSAPLSRSAPGRSLRLQVRPCTPASALLAAVRPKPPIRPLRHSKVNHLLSAPNRSLNCRAMIAALLAELPSRTCLRAGRGKPCAGEVHQPTS
jgi:hypothetical protein